MTRPKVGAQETGESWRDNYITPAYILDPVTEFLGNWVDPAPIDPEVDSLSLESWTDGPKYINPPFSKYKLWVDYCKAGKGGSGPQIWMANTNNSTGWFKDLLEISTAVCLLKNRVKFIDPRTGIQTASTMYGKSQCLIYLGPHPLSFCSAMKELGHNLITINV